MGYLGYWGLFDKPFARSAGEYFFSGSPQREAIAGLSYFVASRFGVAFLVAPPRCGASSLMQRVCQMHGLGDCAAEVVMTWGQHADCSEVSASLGLALGLCKRGQDSQISIAAIDRAIETSRRGGVRVIWLVDRLQSCTVNMARSLLAVHSNLSVVLAASDSEHRRFARWLGEEVVRIDLDPLCLEETAAYLRDGLANVGCTRSLFADGAAVRLNELTLGAIADLALAAELSLSLAARYRMDSVTTVIVEAALEACEACEARGRAA